MCAPQVQALYAKLAVKFLQPDSDADGMLLQTTNIVFAKASGVCFKFVTLTADQKFNSNDLQQMLLYLSEASAKQRENIFSASKVTEVSIAI